MQSIILETSYRYFPVDGIKGISLDEAVSCLNDGITYRFMRVGETLTMTRDYEHFKAGDIVTLRVPGTPANANVFEVIRAATET